MADAEAAAALVAEQLPGLYAEARAALGLG